MGAGCMPVHACTCVRPGCVYNIIHVCIFQGMALSVFVHVKLIHEHIIILLYICPAYAYVQKLKLVYYCD